MTRHSFRPDGSGILDKRPTVVTAEAPVALLMKEITGLEEPGATRVTGNTMDVDAGKNALLIV